MSGFINAGLVTGIGTVIWTFVMGFTGWYKDPALMALFFLVAVLEVVMVILALRQHARENVWWDQVRGGITTGMVASPIIFAGSFAFTKFVFPTYFADITAMGEKMMREGRAAEADIQAYLASQAAQTSVSNAMAGVIGTLVTAVVVAAIGGAFLRKKS
jgi:hypothetical protein